MATPASNPPTACHLILPSDLSPAEADSVKEEAELALMAADKTGAVLRIAFESDRAAPCALQLFVATRRSAEAAGVTVEMPEETANVISSMGLKT